MPIVPLRSNGKSKIQDGMKAATKRSPDAVMTNSGIVLALE
jgi:hypothetical protein